MILLPERNVLHLRCIAFGITALHLVKAHLHNCCYGAIVEMLDSRWRTYRVLVHARSAAFTDSILSRCSLDDLVDNDLTVTFLWVILNNSMGIDESLKGIWNLQESIIPDIIFRLSVNS